MMCFEFQIVRAQYWLRKATLSVIHFLWDSKPQDERSKPDSKKT